MEKYHPFEAPELEKVTAKVAKIHREEPDYCLIYFQEDDIQEGYHLAVDTEDGHLGVDLRSLKEGDAVELDFSDEVKLKLTKL